MLSQWKRPLSAPFPSIWRRFTAKCAETDEIVEYRVQDLPEDRYEEAVALLVQHFLHDEPMCKAGGAAAEAQSVEGFSNAWRGILKDKISLVCFREGCDEIVGVNVLKLCSKDVDEGIPDNAGKACTDMLRAMDFATRNGDLFARYGVDKFFAGFALLVVPKYRGLHLSEEILKARVPLGRAIGVHLTSTVFTNKFSQAAAARAGFEETYVISYADLRNAEPQINFAGVETEFVKLMSMRM